MWAEACDMIAQAEGLQRQFFRLAGPGQTPAAWEPPVDVFENEREILIVAAMPGVSAERVQVTLDKGALVVRGNRALPFDDTGHWVLRLEIPYGAFERRIALPPGRFEIGRPELVQGCLAIRLVKLGPAEKP